MVVNRALGKQTQRGSDAMNDIISEDRRRGNDNSSARLQTYRHFAKKVLLVENVLNQRQHDNAIEPWPKSKGISIQISDMKLGIWKPLPQALNVSIVAFDPHVVRDLL